MKPIDISGNKYGRLLVLSQDGNRKSESNGLTETMWKCQCDCGNILSVPKHLLTSGNTRSCGCLKRDHNKAVWTKHGKTNTRLYRIWQSMKYRCYSKSSGAYKYYGGKGVRVSDLWIVENGFQNFYEWAMANGYNDNLTIERVDVNGDYTQSNCTWIPKESQTKNRTNTNWVYHNGEKYTLTDASKKYGFDRATIRKRIKTCNGDSNAAIEELIKDRNLRKQKKCKGK